MSNVYFELTREFNRNGRVAILSSGQAVVRYQLAIMSKDGDWIIAESPEACGRVLDVLASHGARYRPGAPLDMHWLAHGWSSHFQFADDRGRRIRCDFVARAPRISKEAVEKILQGAPEDYELAVIDLVSLIATKRTQRAKDYAVIGELARLLPPEQELLYTTDPDRILELVPDHGAKIERGPVSEVLRGGSRTDVVVALAKETDHFQQLDKARLHAFEQASARFLRRFRDEGVGALPLPEAHEKVLALATEALPQNPAPGSEQESSIE